MSSDTPSNSEIAHESNPVRRAILAAMQRILLGQPSNVDPGSKTISDLAKEAKVGRYLLYQSHPDLRDRFIFLRDRAGKSTEGETQLRARLEKGKIEIVRLKELQLRTHARAQEWKALVEILERAVNVLQEEFRQEQIRSERLARRIAQSQSQNVLPPVVPIRGRTFKQ